MKNECHNCKDLPDPPGCYACWGDVLQDLRKENKKLREFLEKTAIALSTHKYDSNLLRKVFDLLDGRKK
jgi:hypothetical protein